MVETLEKTVVGAKRVFRKGEVRALILECGAIMGPTFAEGIRNC